ncbi:hypothetical protein [Methylobacterium hispanicum]|uniref:hypothetical protein n=1 Tax=Methylobacterium hispanicum TaxID=270350 RepID=UPI002F2D383F
MLTVQNLNGVQFNVFLIRKGESYGKEHRLTRLSDDPLIQFFDASERDASGSEGGSFLAERSLGDLETHANTDGHALVEGNPMYDLSEGNLRQILAWVRL